MFNSQRARRSGSTFKPECKHVRRAAASSAAHLNSSRLHAAPQQNLQGSGEAVQSGRRRAGAGSVAAMSRERVGIRRMAGRVEGAAQKGCLWVIRGPRGVGRHDGKAAMSYGVLPPRFSHSESVLMFFKFCCRFTQVREGLRKSSELADGLP